jgi:hypothetical protein
MILLDRFIKQQNIAQKITVLHYDHAQRSTEEEKEMIQQVFTEYEIVF